MITAVVVVAAADASARSTVRNEFVLNNKTRKSIKFLSYLGLLASVLKQ